MIEIVLKIVMFIGVVGVILGTLGWLVENIQNKSISNLTIEDLNIPKTKFINMINDWGYTNIKSNNPKPSISVSYYKNKKVSGVYYSSNNSITVFVNNSPQLIDIVNVVLHEYTHSTQRTKGFDKLYNQYTEDKGYWDNPFEIECREISKQYQYQCLQDLITKNHILKLTKTNCQLSLESKA